MDDVGHDVRYGSPMSRHGQDIRFSSPAVERARARAEERERARHQGDTGRVQGDRVDLAVLVDDLNSGSVHVKEDLPAAWVSQLVDDKADIKWSGNEAGRVDVTLQNEATTMVRMKGEARFSLLHPCVRCGQVDVPFEVPLAVDLRLVERAEDNDIEADFEEFSDGDDHAGLPLGNAADLEDINIASYVGSTIAVDHILREQLFLELPPHPNCESVGACLKGPCGLVEREQALQAERERFIDPRWAGLLAIKDQLPVSSDVAGPQAPAIKKGRREPMSMPTATATAKSTAKSTATPVEKAVTAAQVTTTPTTTSAVPAPAPAKKATTKKAPTKKAPTKKAPTKKAPTKKATTKKATTKKAPAKKATTKKATKKAPAKKAPAKKATKKAPTKKAPTKKAPTKKATTKKAPAKKAPAKKSTTKKATKKAPARAR